MTGLSPRPTTSKSLSSSIYFYVGIDTDETVLKVEVIEFRLSS